MEALANYRQLLANVDSLCESIGHAFADAIACRPGCADCCRHITVLPVEAAALAAACAALPGGERAALRASAGKAAPDSPCPLLADGLCLLYHARPIICRTHGLPLLVTEGENRRVDHCPENFRSLPSLPGSAVIDLDRLNTALVAVNALYITHPSVALPTGKERLTIAEALSLRGGPFREETP